MGGTASKPVSSARLQGSRGPVQPLLTRACKAHSPGALCRGHCQQSGAALRGVRASSCVRTQAQCLRVLHCRCMCENRAHVFACVHTCVCMRIPVHADTALLPVRLTTGAASETSSVRTLRCASPSHCASHSHQSGLSGPLSVFLRVRGCGCCDHVMVRHRCSARVCQSQDPPVAGTCACAVCSCPPARGAPRALPRGRQAGASPEPPAPAADGHAPALRSQTASASSPPRVGLADC